MKILAVVPTYPPGARIGAFLATHEFMRRAVERDHDVSVFAYLARGRGWDVDRIPVETGIRGRSHAHRIAPAYDVVVSHAGDDGLGLEVAERAGLPSVRLYHGAGRARTGGRVDLVVYNSHASQAGSGLDWSGPSIVCRPFTRLDRHQTTPAGEMVTLVNISADKGIRTAWRAAEDLPHREFLGVRGGYGAQIVPRARNFVVWGTQGDMRAVWARTRVLLMPSSHETWGMVGVEAMSCGIPVIAHPTPGLVEMLGPAGTLVDRDDRAGWAREVERLFDPAEWAAASTAALARVAELPDDRDVFVDALEQIAAKVPA